MTKTKFCYPKLSFSGQNSFLYKKREDFCHDKIHIYKFLCKYKPIYIQNDFCLDFCGYKTLPLFTQNWIWRRGADWDKMTFVGRYKMNFVVTK